MRFTNPRFLGRKYDPVSLDNVNLEREGEIAILTLNNPNRRNALSLCVMLKVLDHLNDIEQDRSIRAVILAAVGNVYCSGHDLSELVDRTEDEYHHIFAVCMALMTRIQSIPQRWSQKSREWPQQQGASWLQRAIWQSRLIELASPPRVYDLAFSVQHRWWRSAELSGGSVR
jgi:hypothetical protein